MMLEARHGGAIGTADAAAISDLRRLGFADPVDASDRRLLALLSTFDLKLQLGRSLDGGAWIAAAVWDPWRRHGRRCVRRSQFPASGRNPFMPG